MALDARPAPGGGPPGEPAGVVFDGTVEVSCSLLYLRDRAYRPTLRTDGIVGLVTTRTCEVVLVTGTPYGPVPCTVVVARHDPGALLEGFEDVEEAAFASPTGVVSLAGRETGHPPRAGIRLPGGPGPYRLRYHARNLDRTDGEHLLQIWPAPEAPPVRLKLTSSYARYWAELGDVRAEAAAPPVPDGVGGNAGPAGRAAVTEALAADVASTYWSHLLLRPGDHVRSRRAWLVFRSDGNLVVCDEDARVRWTSGTAGRGAYAAFQIDGSLAVYNGDGGEEWNSGTHGYAGNFLAVQDDGNVVVYRADGNALWATGTGH